MRSASGSVTRLPASTSRPSRPRVFRLGFLSSRRNAIQLAPPLAMVPKRLAHVTFVLATLRAPLGCAPHEPAPVTVHAAAQSAPPPALVHVQILAFNDFHGNLEPPSGRNAYVAVTPTDPIIPAAADAGVVPSDAGTLLVPAGGAAYLGTLVRRLRRENPNTLFVSAGDLTGASPLLSNLFSDEPSVLVMNALSLDFEGVGNHDFDRGIDELYWLQHGGPPADPRDAGADADAFQGASFVYLAANVRSTTTGKTVFPPYAIKELAGVRIAFIGVTLQGTPSVLSAKGAKGLTFGNEATSVNALIPEIQAKGVSAIVLLLHQGGFQGPAGTYDACDELTGDILPILRGDPGAGRPGLSPAVDVVASGHTHQAYDCVIDGRLVTSAASYGRVLTKIDLAIDPVLHRVVEKHAKNLPVTRDAPADPEVSRIIGAYKDRATLVMERVVGYVKGDFVGAKGSANASCETPLGELIADAELQATSEPANGGAEIAFMNPGGVRADLMAKGPHKPDFTVTYGEAFEVQPFGNDLVTMTLTGAQLMTLLDEQFGHSKPRILQASRGFSYAYTYKRATNTGKIDVRSVLLNGAPLDLARTYRVTVNSFLATGGNDFSVLKDGAERLSGPNEIDAFTDYLTRSSSLSAPLVPPRVLGRIRGNACR